MVSPLGRDHSPWGGKRGGKQRTLQQLQQHQEISRDARTTGRPFAPANPAPGTDTTKLQTHPVIKVLPLSDTEEQGSGGRQGKQSAHADISSIRTENTS